MAAMLLGRKVGMTRLYDEDGKNVPVTVIQAGPCFVSQIKTEETDGYDAIQIAFEDIKGRNSTMPKIGHDGKAGLGPMRHHGEFRISADEVANYELGQKIDVDSLAELKFVDVISTSKGKGFAGTMKRHNFKGQLATHGVERKHRSPGSVSGRASYLGGGRPKKGIKMSGQMGNARVTVRSVDIVQRDNDKNLLIVKGPVPGANGGLVVIREAIRLFKSKGSK